MPRLTRQPSLLVVKYRCLRAIECITRATEHVARARRIIAEQSK